MLIFIAPPPIKPSEPGLSAFAAAQLLRRMGGRGGAIDASLGWYQYVLRPDSLPGRLDHAVEVGRPEAELTAWRRSIRSVTQARPLHKPATYRDRKVYTSAIGHFEQVLKLVALPYPGVHLRIAQIEVERPGLRPESSAGLLDLSLQPGPCDDYFVEALIPELKRRGATKVAISLTFQPQAPIAMRLARLLREHLPGVERILGGPLVACWFAAGTQLDVQPFDLFDRVLEGTDADLRMLAAEVRDPLLEPAVDVLAEGPLSVDLDQVAWDQYLAPKPTVPAVLGRGCYWRRCTFCPDFLHPSLKAAPRDALESWLHAVAERFPQGAMIHFTDSAMPPSHLGRVAEIIRRDQLPLQWRGFVRVERNFANPEYVRQLAEGGCAMLQLGVETGSQRVMDKLGKGGGDPALSRQVLKVLGEAGIRCYVYLLFGVPGETDEDREQTLAMVEDHQPHIHALNLAILNLPRGSPMSMNPEEYGITQIVPFHVDTDLSLYDDFRCGEVHPRTEARRWLDHRFAKSPAVRRIGADLRSPFKENHVWAL
jgi:hypothetical protein